MSGSLPDTGTTLQIVHWKIADEIPHPRSESLPHVSAENKHCNQKRLGGMNKFRYTRKKRSSRNKPNRKQLVTLMELSGCCNKIDTSMI